MTENVKCIYLLCAMIEFCALLAAAIVKPEWWGAFLALGISIGLSLGIRIEEWKKEMVEK